nr:class I SAM-dependent methyltransferase [Listeria costaricensis]
MSEQTIGAIISHHNHIHTASDQPDKTAKIIAALESPERKAVLAPEAFLDMLPVDGTSDVLDLGAGSGYLTFPAAKHTTGKVYALDINPLMLKILNERIQAGQVDNVELLKGSADRIPLPDEKVDAVMASLILHEVPSLAAVLQEISRVLKPDGCFACIEFEKNTEAGPPMHMRISAAEMEQAAVASGFKLLRKEYLNDELYVLICKKN